MKSPGWHPRRAMFEVRSVGMCRRPGFEALAVSAGMVLFAVFAHRGWPAIVVGAGGLLVAVVVVAQTLARVEDPAALLGCGGFSRRALWLSVVGGGVGLGLGVLHRAVMALPLLPAGGWEAFAVVAGLIGATEELVYRGWMQGKLRELGRPAAVGAAALAHAAYKTGLFVWPPEPFAGNLVFLGLLTFAGGIGFGALREMAGSVVPPVVAHVVFDLLVYGAVAQAPWWVWS